MLKKVEETFKNLDKITSKIMKKGLKFCFGICLIASIILITYNMLKLSPFTYYIGISLLRLSIIFSTEFIICGLVVDGIKKQLI